MNRLDTNNIIINLCIFYGKYIYFKIGNCTIYFSKRNVLPLKK